MDWAGNFVYIPVWLLALLVFLASGAVQYALVAAVRLVIRLDQERQRQHREAQTKLREILRIDKGRSA